MRKSDRSLLEQSIDENYFLLRQTVERLRMTIQSTLHLIEVLLTEYNFKYVLTSKTNQDCLEKFFGIIRQISGPNDHPSTPTFLQLYRMLSVYSVIKPPKTGNCTILENNTPDISITDLKNIINDQNIKLERTDIINNLKEKLDNVVENGCWELNDVFVEYNYSTAPDSTVFECVVYYLSGYIIRRLQKTNKCEVCLNCLKNMFYETC